jgi:hypothetical protein
MALTQRSLEAVKSTMLIAGIAAGIFLPLGIASVIWPDGFRRTALIIVTLPFAVVAMLIYHFCLKLPYPSPYGHGRGLVASRLFVRTHLRDIVAMLITGTGAGAFTSTLVALFRMS